MHNHTLYKKHRFLLMNGTFLEYFDLMLYVHMASIINEVFFDTTSAFNQKWLPAFSFCSTFLLKPFGGIIVGFLGDRYGRKSVLLYCTISMAFCCLTIAILPPFAQIGVIASVIITFTRIIQGISSIGEVTSSEIYMAENLSLPERYFNTALISYAGVVGMAAALLLAKAIILLNWHWRIVFFLGSSIAWFGYKIRLNLVESPEFLSTKNKLKTLMNINSETAQGIKKIKYLNLNKMLNKSSLHTKISYFCVFCGWPICFYFSYVFCAGILKTRFGFSKEMVIHHNFCLAMINLIGLFTWIWLTRYIHPLKILVFKIFLYIPFIFFLPYLLDNAESANHILIIQSLCIVLGNSTIPAKGVFVMHFGTLERFKYSAFLNGLSHVVLYIITSFGLTYITEIFGKNGILFAFLLITTIYTYGVLQFIKLEKNTGDYYLNFNNLLKKNNTTS